MVKEEKNLGLTILKKSLGIRNEIEANHYKTQDKYKSKNVDILRFENKKAILINGVTDENVHTLEILDTKG